MCSTGCPLLQPPPPHHPPLLPSYPSLESYATLNRCTCDRVCIRVCVGAERGPFAPTVFVLEVVQTVTQLESPMWHCSRNTLCVVNADISSQILCDPARSNKTRFFPCLRLGVSQSVQRSSAGAARGLWMTECLSV